MKKRFGYEIYFNTDEDIVVKQENGMEDMFIVISKDEVEMLCADLIEMKKELTDVEKKNA